MKVWTISPVATSIWCISRRSESANRPRRLGNTEVDMGGMFLANLVMVVVVVVGVVVADGLECWVGMAVVTFVVVDNRFGSGRGPRFRLVFV